MKRSGFIVLGLIQSFVAIMAIPAGVSMIIQPDGSDIGISSSILDNSPFADFLIPGILLLYLIGLFNLVAAIYSFRKSIIALNIAIFSGLLLAGWIIIQFCFIGLISFLQPLFFGIALTEIILAFYFKHKKKNNQLINNRYK